MKKLYHFIGGIRFAIILITLTALFVVMGTILESYSESHLYASQYTYQNPFFYLLLAGFFLNILISALRRWPFKTQHIPFLITHLGLLMILTGTFVKNIFGTQGNMGILEGSISQEIFIPHTQALRIDEKDPQNPQNTITAILPLPLPNQFAGLKIRQLNQTPHSKQLLELWLKSNYGLIAGIKPFPIIEEDELNQIDQIPLCAKVKLNPKDEQSWEIIAIRTSNAKATAEKIYLQKTRALITDSHSKQVIQNIPLDKVSSINSTQSRKDAEAQSEPLCTSASLRLCVKNILENPELELHYSLHSSLGTIAIPLSGNNSLLNENLTTPYLGPPPILVDLIANPTIVILADLEGNNFILYIGPHGELENEQFNPTNLSSLYQIDEGFSGYSLQTEKDLSLPYLNRTEKEAQSLTALKTKLREAITTAPELTPPLQILYETTKATGQDFVEIAVGFLSEWDQSQSWLYPVNQQLSKDSKIAFEKLDWQQVPHVIQKGAQLSSLLLSDIDLKLKNGQSIHEILKEKQWPLLKALPQNENPTPDETALLLYTLHQQVNSVADQIPNVDTSVNLDPEQKAHVYSALLRSYGIHLRNLLLPIEEAPSSKTPFRLETPVTRRIQPLPPGKKLEDNLPAIALEISDQYQKEIVNLSYDRYGTGLKWPLLNGKYLARFQSLYKQIPYSIRLRDARQINYPNSNQPLSYEADLIITDLRNQNAVEKTISMNNVHETWDGYRFYLANISPPNEVTSQRVQIIVNHDPGKYILTYPGAILISLGIVLLFWMRPYNKKRENEKTK